MKQVFTAAILLASSTLAAPTMAATELSFNIFFPKNHFTWPVFEAWSEDVADATNGEINITFLEQSVAPPPRIMNAVRDGMVDGGVIFNGFIENESPATLLSQMPWMHNGDSAAVSQSMWEKYNEHFAKVEKFRGVKLVSMFNFGPAFLCSDSNSPIDSLEALRQRRIWALPSTIAYILSDMNLPIVKAPTIQAIDLISRNSVDAHFGLTLEAIVSFGVARYTISCVDLSPSLQSPNFSVFFNNRAWLQLSDKHKEAITQLSGSHLATRFGKASNIEDAAARATLEAQGVVFYTASADLKAALETSANKIADQWAARVSKKYGVDAAAVVEQMRTELNAIAVK